MSGATVSNKLNKLSDDSETARDSEWQWFSSNKLSSVCLFEEDAVRPPAEMSQRKAVVAYSSGPVQ
jgi:hypothetical protein